MKCNVRRGEVKDGKFVSCRNYLQLQKIVTVNFWWRQKKLNLP
jgi:hypothetical protein